MTEPAKCRITSVDTSTTGLNPIIVNFQNGTLRSDAAKSVQCGIYQHKDSKRRCIAMSNGTGLYQGYEEEDALCQTFLAIRNKHTNEMRLVATTRALLAPIIDREEKTNETETSSKNIAKDLTQLAKSFGSKRGRRYVEQKERMNLSVDAVKDLLEATASKVDVNLDELELPTMDFADCLPPCNRSAKSLEVVYNLFDVVNDLDIKELEPESIRILEAGEEEFTLSSYKYSVLFKYTFTSVCKINDKKAQLNQMAALLYMEYLVSLLKMSPRALNKRAPVCSLSNRINKKILENFTVDMANGRLLSLEMKDKTTCYILILALILNNFSVPIEKIMDTISCNIDHLSILCRTVAAIIKTEDLKKCVVIKLPLIPMQLVQKKLTIKRNRKKNH